jgi:hypothetical protein
MLGRYKRNVMRTGFVWTRLGKDRISSVASLVSSRLLVSQVFVSSQQRPPHTSCHPLYFNLAIGIHSIASSRKYEHRDNAFKEGSL